MSRATDKQIRYVKHLLSKNGYDTRYIDSSFKNLGLTMKERSGAIDDIDFDVAAKIIDALKGK